ncbi:pyrimidine reductase family protein [Pseudactinotalea sp. Z1739]|uniref:pyrimidine reductase family protein n=1 Tax=Pseudactinotalea sp. Z1739 TaxID=3413028 RepID=UPI003C79D5C5
MTDVFDLDDLLTRYQVPDRSRTHLRTNFVTSLDGAATHNGLTQGLNNEADHQVFHTLRMLADVVLVGAGTVRNEGYEELAVTDARADWRTAQGWPPHPVMAVVSRTLDLDPGAPLFTRAPVRPIVFTTTEAPEGPRSRLGEVADVVSAGSGSVEPGQVVAELTRRGLPQILSEGGPAWFATMIEHDAVDEMCLTLSPLLEGGDATRIVRDGRQRTSAMSLLSLLRAEDMLILRYVRPELAPAR